MRDIFWETVYSKMTQNGKIVVLMSDTGFGVLDKIRKEMPGRCYNTGIREQGTIGLASGMTEAGMFPLMYAITPFATVRPLEFIRVLMDIQQKPVTIVGVGAGLDYSTLGATHHGDIDIGVMRLLYGMNILCPCDEEGAKIIAEQLPFQLPTYIRLSRYSPPSLYDKEAGWLQAGTSRVKEGNDGGFLGVFSTGVILKEVIRAADEVGEAIGDMPTLYDVSRFPLSITDIAPFLAQHQKIITVEEHNVTGGLGSAIAELMAMTGEPYYSLMCLGINNYIRIYDRDRHNILSAARLSHTQIAKAITINYNGKEKCRSADQRGRE